MSLFRLSNLNLLFKGPRDEHRQYRSSDDLAGDVKQNPGGGEFSIVPKPLVRTYVSHIEAVFLATPRGLNPISALIPSDHTLDSGCASPRITLKVEEGGEDDIPVSIRKSFKELRSVKDELERQV